jgi:putative flippase GtrA
MMEKLIKLTKDKFYRNKNFILYSIIGISGAGIDAIVYTILVKYNI